MADSFLKRKISRKNSKAKEKALRREERKTNNNKGKDMEDVFMYVDEFGRLTSTPPEQRQEVNLDDIQLGAAPIIEEDPRKTGIVTFLSEKGYGFITEDNSKENIFFHNNNCAEPVKKETKFLLKRKVSKRIFCS
jgi:hypothetical protein